MNEMWKSVIPASHRFLGERAIRVHQPVRRDLDRAVAAIAAPAHQRQEAAPDGRLAAAEGDLGGAARPRRRSSCAITAAVAMFSCRISSVIEQ